MLSPSSTKPTEGSQRISSDEPLELLAHRVVHLLLEASALLLDRVRSVVLRLERRRELDLLAGDARSLALNSCDVKGPKSCGKRSKQKFVEIFKFL